MSFDKEVTAHMTTLAQVTLGLRDNAQSNCGRVISPLAESFLDASLNARQREIDWLSARGMCPDIGDSVFKNAHTKRSD